MNTRACHRGAALLLVMWLIALLASLIGRAVNDVARAADQLVVNFRGGSLLTMSLQPATWHANDALTLIRSANSVTPQCTSRLC